MHKTLLLIICLLLTLQADAEEILSHYKVRHFTTAQGLPGNTVRDIQQDSDGFLWMAGTGGLARFDGYRFVPFNGFGHGGHRGIPRHIGKLLMTPSKDQLWVSTATYNQACYDLKLGRFIDYTGKGDDERPYRKLLHTRNGIWMWSSTEGVRHVTNKDGKYRTVDYNVQNHKLPGNDVRWISEDKNGTVWISTDKGLVRVDSLGHIRTLLKGKTLMRGDIYGDRVLSFSRFDQTAYIFNLDGRLLCKGKLYTAMGHISAVRGLIPWHGKWIIFAGYGTYAVDMKTGQFSKPMDIQMNNGSDYCQIGDLWFVGNRTGTLYIFPKNGNVRKLHLFDTNTPSQERNTIFTVTRGKDGLYYIGSYGGGLFVYDYRTGKVENYTAESSDPLIYTNYILYVTTDKSGCIWVSTENGGVSCLIPSTQIAEYYLINPNDQGGWANAILSFLPSSNADVLNVETRDRKFYNFSLASSSFEYKGESKDAISGYVTDNKGNIWTATRGSGLLLNGQKIDVYINGKRTEVQDYKAITKDIKGRIWLGTWGQGLLLVQKVIKNKVYVNGVIPNQYNENRINDIVTTPDGYVFVATLNGLYALSIKNLSDVNLYHLAASNFPADEINCICLGKNHTVWVGTIGAGLVRCDFSKGLKGMTYKSLTTSNGLSNNNIRSLVFDRSGYLWVGSDDGLSRIDPKDNYIRIYRFTDHVLSNTFSGGSASLLADGRLAFGTANGLAIVNPVFDKNTPDSSDLSAPLISDILVNGTSIYEGLDSVITDRALSASSKIKLSYGQNSLTIYFSSCDYSEIPSQIYQYYLEGLDKHWRPATGDTHAEYTNLSPGSYVFHLRMVTQRGTGKETVLKIHIAEPWYNTVWAWIIYLLLGAAIILYISRNARERLLMHQQVMLEKQVAEFRTNFFTHVTHEFRTPLAILQNAVEKIAESGNGSKKDVLTAQRGIRRLLRLVNQFLEYRRIESGKQRLQIEKGDIVTFIQDIFHDFRIMAEQKHITLIFTPFAKHFEMMFDRQLVESVVYNLLSNAVKYTPDNSSVTVLIQKDNDNIHIIVEDSGNGITGEQRADIFRPFMEGHVSKGGMGIGLYTSYSMAKLHHGSLSYADAEPHGARFTFTLPAYDDVYTSEDYAKTTSPVNEHKEDDHYREVIREMAPKSINSQLVAIIEDDADMQEQIANEVGVYFQTEVYGTGKAAIDGIKKSHPSLILCDIMLPDTNGYEIVKKLKEDADLRDIPVIMLTALEDENHQIKGYQVGADDYMVKPCNYHLLVARMMQLIQWHINNEKEAKQASENASQAVVAEPKKTSDNGEIILTSRADKRFREQVETIVTQHLDDQTLSVDRLAEMMSMGRTKFYGKVKDIFGMSPNKYLLSRRMEAAAEYLDEGKYNVSEVSYMVGFSDPAYFNKCFKSHFGMVPSKYKER